MIANFATTGCTLVSKIGLSGKPVGSKRSSRTHYKFADTYSPAGATKVCLMGAEMRRRLEAFIPIVVLAVLVQLMAPIAAFRVVAYATTDPLYLASLCSEMTSASDTSADPAKTQHQHGDCCAFCVGSHGGVSRRRSAAANFCKSATLIPADIVARSRRGDAGIPRRLKQSGARTSAVHVNCAAPWAVPMRSRNTCGGSSCRSVFVYGPDSAHHKSSAQRVMQGSPQGCFPGLSRLTTGESDASIHTAFVCAREFYRVGVHIRCVRSLFCRRSVFSRNIGNRRSVRCR